MAYPISDVTRRVVYTGSAGVGPYSFTFEVLANTDIQVYKNTTLLTLTTNYTVTINANGTGSVTLVVAATGADNITIVGDRAIQRATDFVTGGDLFANTLNDEFDSLVIFAQQVDEKADRGLKAPVTDPTDVNMVLPVKVSRASKYLAFDSDGNPVATSGTGTSVVSTVMEPVVSAASLSVARTNLGLASGATTTVGTMATQNASAVAITGGTIDNANLSNTFGFKNRIINGAFQVSQYNGTSATTPSTDVYVIDRFRPATSQASKLQWQQNKDSITPPAGFSTYLGASVASTATIGAGDLFGLVQIIEGLNVADLNWGTANASAVTLSFKVYSSETGSFGGAVGASAGGYSYPFTYTISSANTWTTISITIVGPTAGTWTTNNTASIQVFWGFGVGSTFGSGTASAWVASTVLAPSGAKNIMGTASATFYITGVQLEKGSTSTSFDYRPYGTELALCQRYFCLIPTAAGGTLIGPWGGCYSTSAGRVWYKMPVTMRAVPTATYTSNGFSLMAINDTGTGTVANQYFSTEMITFDGTSLSNTVSIGVPLSYRSGGSISAEL